MNNYAAQEYYIYLVDAIGLDEIQAFALTTEKFGEGWV